MTLLSTRALPRENSVYPRLSFLFQFCVRFVKRLLANTAFVKATHVCEYHMKTTKLKMKWLSKSLTVTWTDSHMPGSLLSFYWRHVDVNIFDMYVLYRPLLYQKFQTYSSVLLSKNHVSQRDYFRHNVYCHTILVTHSNPKDTFAFNNQLYYVQ